MCSNLYADEITTEEMNLGFQLRTITNPEIFAYSQSTIQAVIYDHNLGSSERIIKTRLPDRAIRYKHQRYGMLKCESDSQTKPEPEWHPFGDTDSFTPEEAINKAILGVEDDSTCQVIPHTPPTQSEETR